MFHPWGNYLRFEDGPGVGAGSNHPTEPEDMGRAFEAITDLPSKTLQQRSLVLQSDLLISLFDVTKGPVKGHWMALQKGHELKKLVLFTSPYFNTL